MHQNHDLIMRHAVVATWAFFNMHKLFCIPPQSECGCCGQTWTYDFKLSRSTPQPLSYHGGWVSILLWTCLENTMTCMISVIHDTHEPMTEQIFKQNFSYTQVGQMINAAL